MIKGVYVGMFGLLLMACANSMTISKVDAAETRGIGSRIADYIMERWPNPDRITSKQWEYTNGIIFCGMEAIYHQTKNPEYYHYIKKWVDKYVDQKGKISPIRSGHNLDVIQPSNLLFTLYETSGDPKYKLCAINTRKKFDDFPTNSKGGFWHKANYPNQMWLDGQYMALPFIAKYGVLLAEPGPEREYSFQTAVFQLKLMAEQALDREKKLLYHGWDDKKITDWADPETGLSPEFWCRGLGWYCMALVDTLEYLPSDYPGYQDLVAILETVAEGLAAYQDPVTGLWFQVIDKGDNPIIGWRLQVARCSFIRLKRPSSKVISMFNT